MVMASDTTRPQVVHELKLSSVVPARITAENTVHELTAGDLLMKLHYINGVYYFTPEAARGITIGDLKEPMFRCLELYYPVSGRIRRQDPDGRPVIKCNDGGVRIVEARCERSVDEWLEMEARGDVDEMELLYRQALGPDLGFSPMVYIQFTWFNCGGISVGLSWAHVLGDALSASSFINMWGRFMAGHVPSKILHVATTKMHEPPVVRSGTVSSARQVGPVGDSWTTSSNRKMKKCSIRITRKQLDLILDGSNKDSEFETLSAMVWKSLSKIRGNNRIKTVTICTSSHLNVGDHLPMNSMIISTVDADFSVSDVSEVAARIAKGKNPENAAMEEMVERNLESDFIVFGANLTFVNLEGADIYGLELKGRKPIFANYFIGGVGEEGAVLVIPWQEDGKAGGDGRVVRMILPENEVAEAAREVEEVFKAPLML